MKIVEYKQKYEKEMISMLEGIQDFERNIFPHREEGKKLATNWLKKYDPEKNSEYILVGLIDEKPMAFVWSYYSTDELNSPTSKYLYISDLFVKEEYRGMGFGSILIHFCEKRAKELGNIKGSFISVLANNIDAYNLYMKSGYKENEITLYKEF